MFKLLVILLAAAVFGYYAYRSFSGRDFFTGREVKEISCTMEAKLCPDGSAVGRVGPNCEFAACP